MKPYERAGRLERFCVMGSVLIALVGFAIVTVVDSLIVLVVVGFIAFAMIITAIVLQHKRFKRMGR